MAKEWRMIMGVIRGAVSGILKKEIIEILASYHVGKDKAVTIGRLSQALGHKDRGMTSPQLRGVIRTILSEGEYPIASCNKGYYLMSTEEERTEYLKNLEDRKKGIEDRINWITFVDLWETGSK
jgi:hypothetical protein